jgi:hypothetical protein
MMRVMMLLDILEQLLESTLHGIAIGALALPDIVIAAMAVGVIVEQLRKVLS